MVPDPVMVANGALEEGKVLSPQEMLRLSQKLKLKATSGELVLQLVLQLLSLVTRGTSVMDLPSSLTPRNKLSS